MRRVIVTLAFLAAIVGVVVLNSRAAGGVVGLNAASLRLHEVADSIGLDFVHQSPTLDPKVQHIAPHIAALGACVSVADFNNDGNADLYFTSSRFGANNALFLNKGDGTFHDQSEHA